MSTRGVVPDHPANGGPVRGRGIRAEKEAHGLHVGIQLILNQPWLDPAPELFAVHLQDSVHVLGEIQDNGMSNRLTSQRGPTAPWEDWNSVAVCDLDDRLHVPLVAWEDYAYWLNLVNGGIGGVKETRVAVKAHVPIKTFLQLGGNFLILP